MTTTAMASSGRHPDLSRQRLERQEDPQFGSIGEFRHEGTIEYTGSQFNFALNNLCPPRSVTAKTNNIMADCADFAATPRKYRIHILDKKGNGLGANPTFENKLEALSRLEKSILFINHQMLDVKSRFDASEIKAGLAKLKIPVAEIAEFDEIQESFRQVFRALNFKESPERPHPFTVSWRELVDLCHQEKLTRVLTALNAVG